MDIKFHSGLAAMSALQADWQNLADTCQAPVFIDYNWCMYQARLNSEAPLIISAWQNNTCVGILPLTLKSLSRRFNTRVLSHLCQRFTDYQHVLCAPEQLETVVSAMLNSLTASRFKRYSLLINYPDSALRDALLAHSDAVTCQSWQHTMYRIDGAPIKAKVAREARRRMRKLQQTGDIELHTNMPFDEALLNWVLDKSAQRYGSNSLTAATQRESVIALLRDYRAHLHIACLIKNGNYLAAHIGFKQQNMLYYYVPVTSDEERALSPGIILLHEIIQQLPDMQLSAIDFLRGEESYKDDWGNVQRTETAVLVKANVGMNIKDALFTRLWLKRNA